VLSARVEMDVRGQATVLSVERHEVSEPSVPA
jgi:hypothetical protein